MADPELTNEHYLIELRAYSLWQDRGCPWGSADADWFTAESEFKAIHALISDDPIAVAAAKSIGSVLGSITAAVTSVTKSFTSE